jgi:hypothetical protein
LDSICPVDHSLATNDLLHKSDTDVLEQIVGEVGDRLVILAGLFDDD